ncbi:hypothetical protein GF354_00440 [Candidatus Peregrinibacteria bacterium]|nr:hypothetical protein [Candidatus Peregrinibacteria bacterium]
MDKNYKDFEFPEELAESLEFRETLYEGAKNFVDSIIDKNYSFLIFLDKGGRLYARLAKAYWQKHYPGVDFPFVKFLNVGKEKQGVNYEDILARVCKLYPKSGLGSIQSGDKVLLVDELTKTGASLKLGAQLIQDAYPDTIVEMTAIFSFPFNHPDLNMVCDDSTKLNLNLASTPIPTKFFSGRLLRHAPISDMQRESVKVASILADMSLVRNLLKDFFELNGECLITSDSKKIRRKLLHEFHRALQESRDSNIDKKEAYKQVIMQIYPTNDELRKLQPVIDEIIEEVRRKTILYGKYHRAMQKIGEGDL